MQNFGIKARKAIVKSIRFYVLKDIASCLRDFQRTKCGQQSENKRKKQEIEKM